MKYMCAGSVHTHTWACGICALFSSVCAFVCVHTYLSQSASLLVRISLCASLLYVYHSLVYSTMGCIGYKYIALHMYTDNLIQNVPNVPVLLNQHPSPSQPSRLYILACVNCEHTQYILCTTLDKTDYHITYTYTACTNLD